MKEIELSEEVYNKLEEYRRELSEKMGKDISHTEALEALLGSFTT